MTPSNNTINTTIRPMEGGHWYQRDGQPCYEIIGKNGEPREVTLRDARKLDLVPSVTKIISCAAKPQLVRWQVEQAVLAAITFPRPQQEITDAELMQKILMDANEQALKARERGTVVHAWVQSGFEGEELYGEAFEYWKCAYDVIRENIPPQAWRAEESFTREDYGGKIDLCSDDYIIDFKTTNKPLESLKLWDDHYMQLAAYRSDSERCAIVYINSQRPEARLIWAEEDKLLRGKAQFNALKEYFYATTGLRRQCECVTE